MTELKAQEIAKKVTGDVKIEAERASESLSYLFASCGHTEVFKQVAATAFALGAQHGVTRFIQECSSVNQS